MDLEQTAVFKGDPRNILLSSERPATSKRSRNPPLHPSTFNKTFSNFKPVISDRQQSRNSTRQGRTQGNHNNRTAIDNDNLSTNNNENGIFQNSQSLFFEDTLNTSEIKPGMTLDKFLGTGFKALDWNSIPSSVIQLKTKEQNDIQQNYVQRKNNRSISAVVHSFQDKNEVNNRNDMRLRQDTQNFEEKQQEYDKEIENYYLEEDFEIHETEEEHNSESNRESQVDLHIKRQSKPKVDYLKQKQVLNSTEKKEEESVELGVTEGSADWGEDKQARIQMKLREKYSKKTRRKTEILQYLPSLTQKNQNQQGQATSLKRLQQGGSQCFNKNSNSQLAFNNEDKAREDFKGNTTKITTNVTKQYLKSDSGHILSNKIDTNIATMLIKSTATTTTTTTSRARTRSLIASISNRPGQVEQLSQKYNVLGNNRVNSSCCNQANSAKSSNNSNHRNLVSKGGDISSNLSEFHDTSYEQIFKENSEILIENKSKDLPMELQDQKGGQTTCNRVSTYNEDIENEQQLKTTKQQKLYAIRRINQSSSPTQKKMVDRSNQDKKKKYQAFDGIEVEESSKNSCQVSKDKTPRIDEKRKGTETVAGTIRRTILAQENCEGFENRHKSSSHNCSSQQVVLGGRVSSKQGQIADLEKNNKQKEFFSKSFRTSFYNDHKRQNSNLHTQESSGVLTEGPQYQQEQLISRVVPQMQIPLGSRNRRTLNEFYKYKPNQLNENPPLAQLSSNYLQFTQMAGKKDDLVSKNTGYFNFNSQECDSQTLAGNSCKNNDNKLDSVKEQQQKQRMESKSSPQKEIKESDKKKSQPISPQQRP